MAEADPGLTVNMHEAKSKLSKLVDSVERGERAEVLIARNGRPVARIVPIERKRVVKLGLAKGRYADTDWMFTPEMDREIELLFYGEPFSPDPS